MYFFMEEFELHRESYDMILVPFTKVYMNTGMIPLINIINTHHSTFVRDNPADLTKSILLAPVGKVSETSLLKVGGILGL